MKQVFYISVFSLIAFFSNGQSSSVNQVKSPGIYLSDGTKVNEYKKTFEIKEILNPDNTTLSKIDMSKYWKFINASQRIEVLDDVTDLTLILYSRSESETLIDFNSVLIVMPPDHVRDKTKTTP